MGKFKKVGFAYSIMPNSVINDENMSWKSQGIYAYLISKPDGWQFSMDRIEKAKNGGSRQVRSGIKELEKLGYLIRKRQPNGRVDYILFSEPHVQNEQVVKKATCAKRHCGETHPVSKKDLNNKKDLRNSSNSGKNKPMKHYEEKSIELDNLGERIEIAPGPKKYKNKNKIMIKVIRYYMELLGKTGNGSQFLRTASNIVSLAEPLCKDEKEIFEEIVGRIDVANWYFQSINCKLWGLAKVEENWDIILNEWNRLKKKSQ